MCYLLFVVAGVSVRPGVPEDVLCVREEELFCGDDGVTVCLGAE
jgi:hypothetical protein